MRPLRCRLGYDGWTCRPVCLLFSVCLTNAVVGDFLFGQRASFNSVALGMLCLHTASLLYTYYSTKAFVMVIAYTVPAMSACQLARRSSLLVHCRWNPSPPLSTVRVHVHHRHSMGAMGVQMVMISACNSPNFLLFTDRRPYPQDGAHQRSRRLTAGDHHGLSV